MFVQNFLIDYGEVRYLCHQTNLKMQYCSQLSEMSTEQLSANFGRSRAVQAKQDNLMRQIRWQANLAGK